MQSPNLPGKHAKTFPPLSLALLWIGSSRASGASTGSGAPLPERQWALQEALAQAVEGFEGEVGVHVRHLKTGETASIRAGELFPTASMIKMPILLTLFDRIEKQELDYHTTLTWDRKRVYAGDDLLAKHGFEKTRMNSRTPGRKKNWEVYGWGKTTPREMTELLVLIREGRGFFEGAADEMYRNLTRSYWNDAALSQIPPYIQADSKQGSVDASRSEVVLVLVKKGDGTFCYTPSLVLGCSKRSRPLSLLRQVEEANIAPRTPLPPQREGHLIWMRTKICTWP